MRAGPGGCSVKGVETYKDHSIADLLGKDGIPRYGTFAFEFVWAIVALKLLCFRLAQASVCVGAQLLEYFVKGKKEWMSRVKLPGWLLWRSPHSSRKHREF